MPRIVNYPKTSFRSAMDLAVVVDKLGGDCNKETCASQLGKKLSGGFVDRITATKKFGLINVKKGTLSISPLYKDYKLAYNDQEKKIQLKKAFFKAPLFQEIFDKYKNSELPIKILDKVLIKEFEVDERYASRVGKFFIEGAKMIGILNQDNTFNHEPKECSKEEQSKLINNLEKNLESDQTLPKIDLKTTSENYFIHIRGPNINQTIEIMEKDHLTLVDATLSLIKKKLSKKDE